MREDYRKLPADLYGSMKVGCEELGRYYRETYGIEFIALRFVSIYGPGKEARHGPLSFYGQLIEKAREGAKWVIPQGGDQLNDAVYVGDVGRSVYLALKAPTPKEWTFNIGTGKASTPRDFLNAAAKLFPNHKIELGPGPSKLGRSKQSYCIFDISAAQTQHRLRAGVHGRARCEGLRRDPGSIGQVGVRKTISPRRARRARSFGIILFRNLRVLRVFVVKNQIRVNLTYSEF